MKLKGVVFEDFINYKLPSLYIAFPHCSFKCGKAQCQNSPLALTDIIEISKDDLIEQYMSNPITKAIVMAGLEPLDSGMDVISFIDSLRRQYNCNDPVVIYTGYTEEEIENGKYYLNGKETNISFQWAALKKYNNIIVKFGRFQPNQNSHYDEVLGVNLASPNQYAKVISNEN